MSIVDDNKRYEEWLATKCDVIGWGLKQKHKLMDGSVLRFYRATCFRFARKIEDVLVASPLLTAPEVTSVGDAHFENFGTWRDVEGRLVWGINDFDDAATLPYTYDLLRLAASFGLEPELPGNLENQIGAMLDGYRDGLDKPGPCIANREIPWMSTLMSRPAAKMSKFEKELRNDSSEHGLPTKGQQDLLRSELPHHVKHVEFANRQRGGGSLGRPRAVAFGKWRGGLVARECKAMVPSAWE